MASNIAPTPRFIDGARNLRAPLNPLGAAAAAAMATSRANPPPPPLTLSQVPFRRPSVSLPLRPRFRPSIAVSRSCPYRARSVFVASPSLQCSLIDINRRLRNINHHGVGAAKASTSGLSSSSEGGDASENPEGWKVESGSSRTTFLAKLAIALGVAATITMLSVCLKHFSGSSFKLPVYIDGSSSSVPVAPPVGFNLQFLGYRIVIPEYTPGWVYFWLLMAAGCGLFISEEALNVWVGISLARNLTLDGNWQSFAASFSKNASYIISTVLWVYWGVCISDMIPFYLGRLFRKTKASEDICTKLGIGKEKALSITRLVQKYGNLIGFVERFSLGARNPTAFLAGAWGISSELFFVGVCFGGLVTLSIQLAIGFLLRERPVVALASVATVVGIWTVFPYLFAASTAMFLLLQRPQSN